LKLFGIVQLLLQCENSGQTPNFRKTGRTASHIGSKCKKCLGESR